jgi:hypothetical protein
MIMLVVNVAMHHSRDFPAICLGMSFVALTIKTCHWTEATVVLVMMCMPVVWHISTRLVLLWRAHESQQEFMSVLQHLGMWWVTIFPSTNQFPTMTTMPLLCPVAMRHFLARRKLTTTGRMRMFPMVFFWSCIRKCKTCDQIDMVCWTGFLVQNRNIL